MRLLQVLGTGCAKCQKLTQQAEAAAKSLGIEYQLEKITQIDRIMAYGVMTTPALVVDGEVKVAGRVPDLEQLKAMLV